METLPATYDALVNALGEAGLSGAAINDVISKHVSANCVLCGIGIKGDDLIAVSLAHGPEQLADPRLGRLKQGYCCRRSCDSYYYDLSFAPHRDVNWEKIVERLTALETKAPVPREREIVPPSEEQIARRALRFKVAAGAGLVLVLLLLKHVLSGGSLPGLHRAPKYSVDPKSLPATPSR